MFSKNKTAFTLAEVLVTLTIIGVIASLTIPTLKETADRSSNEAALRKAYSTASNAFAQLQAEYGSPIYWRVPTDAKNIDTSLRGSRVFTDGKDQMFAWMLKQKMNVASETGIPPENYQIKKLSGSNLSKTEEKIDDTLIYLGNNTGQVSFQTADNMYWFPSQTYSGCKYKKEINASKYPFSLSQMNRPLFALPAYAADKNLTPVGVVNGDLVSKLNKTVYVCGYLMVDVNGSKSPNLLGMDVFVFDVTTNGVVPHSAEKDDCKDMSGDGYSCSSKVLAGDEHALDFIYD